ncbi:MAG TPA: hypothetical protein VHK47_03240 [Polyangia bacterium]|nr:hypothetical protein [Polyangia bacterium]
MPNAGARATRGILRVEAAARALRKPPPVRLFIGLLGVLVGGCAITTPAPGGPIHAGTYTQFQPQYAMAYGPASMTVDGVRVSGSAQTRFTGGGPFLNPLPLGVAFRQQAAGLEANADVGWVDSGVGVRFAIPPKSAGTAPVVLSLGVRTGRISAFQDDTYQGSLAVEAYPLIARTETRSTRLMLSLGATAGTFVREMLLPDRYMLEGDVPSGSPTVKVLRPEVRLQTSVGVHLSGEHSALGVALSPWFVLYADEPTSVVCQSCSGRPVISDFAQSWGLSLSLTPSIGF